MANIEALLREGIEAVKANRKDEARTLLEKVVDLDQHNEQAWLYLSACVDSLEEQQICLENVLTINPDNQKARKGVEEISRKLAAGSTSVSPFAESTAGLESGPFTGAEDAPPAEGGVPTSVDWGRGKAPAYGSGQHVPQPTSEEYDSWMASLPIGNNKPAESESPFENFDFSAGPFTTASAPFEDLDQIDDPFGGGSSKSGPLPFDTQTESVGPFDDANMDKFEFPSPKAAAGADPFAGSSSSSFTGADRTQDRFGSRARESVIPATGGDADARTDLDELFASGKSDVFGGTNDPFSALAKEKSGGKKRERTPAAASSMYRLIPAEIQVNRGAPSPILLVTVGGLALLNLISLFLLLRNLTG